MFESLSERLQAVFSKLGTRSRVSEDDVSEAMRQVRLALIEADVNLGVVKAFVARVREQAMALIGQESEQRGLNPAQQVISLVNEALIDLLGRERVPLTIASTPPTTILLVGLQGSGKTTHAAKLALHLKEQGMSPMLVAADIYRPAAIQQVVTLGAQVGVPVHEDGQIPPVQIVRNALVDARARGIDVLIIDTAGRLQIDDAMMAELDQLRDFVHPTETLLVVDAMTGQQAVDVAKAFNEQVGLTGLILTKMDGDARGGAALSVREVTGVPIKFIGVGERVDQLDAFYPERMASRILGMGDLLSLMERAQRQFDEKETAAAQEKLLEGSFNLEDFLAQMQQVKKLGPMREILKLIPGMGGQLRELEDAVDDKQLKRVEAIIQSMTTEERRNPDILNFSRKQRVARGSGVTRAEVQALLKQFGEMQKMMVQMGRQSKRAGLRGMLPGGNAPSMADMQQMMQGGGLDALGSGMASGPGGRPGPRPPRPTPNKKKKKR